MRNVRRRTVAPILLLSIAVMSAGFAASAGASNASIKQVLKSALPQIVEEEGRVVTALDEYKKTGNLAPVDEAVNKNVALLKEIRAKIAKQHASNAKGRRGKAKLERGLKRVARAYKKLERALGLKHTHPGASKKLARKALRAIKKADRELEEAVALLR